MLYLKAEELDAASLEHVEAFLQKSGPSRAQMELLDQGLGLSRAQKKLVNCAAARAPCAAAAARPAAVAAEPSWSPCGSMGRSLLGAVSGASAKRPLDPPARSAVRLAAGSAPLVSAATSGRQKSPRTIMCARKLE